MTTPGDALKAQLETAREAYQASLTDEFLTPHDLIVAADYVRVLEAALAEQTARADAAEAALKPFGFNEDEWYETGAFGDEVTIFMRPDDPNDSVRNGWAKQVTFGDCRRAGRLCGLVVFTDVTPRKASARSQTDAAEG